MDCGVNFVDAVSEVLVVISIDFDESRANSCGHAPHVRERRDGIVNAVDEDRLRADTSKGFLDRDAEEDPVHRAIDRRQVVEY